MIVMLMGEAAGLAAAPAAGQAENDVHDVDAARLRKRLKEEGACLPDIEAETVEVRASEQ